MSSEMSLEGGETKASRRASRKAKRSVETLAFASGPMVRQASQVDLTKTLNKNTYFSDVNPRNMKRLMNIIAVTGTHYKSYHYLSSRFAIFPLFSSLLSSHALFLSFLPVSLSKSPPPYIYIEFILFTFPYIVPSH